MTENKRFRYDYKTGRMKDTQSNSQATKNMRILETIINDACYSYEKKIKELESELNNYKPIIFKYDGEDLILYSKEKDNME